MATSPSEKASKRSESPSWFSTKTFSVQPNDKHQKNIRKYQFYASWIIVPLYMFFVVNSGSIYWGYSGGFREIFYKIGAFSWVEPNRRETLIGTLLTVANLSNLIADSVAGNLLDFFGPRYTLICGLLMRFIGWICLAISSQSLQLYIVGMALIGASTDLIYFAFVSCAALFKQKRGLIVSLLGAAMSLSSIVPIIIYQFWETFLSNLSSVIYLSAYACGWLLMMGICAIFLVPVESFESIFMKIYVENQSEDSSNPKESQTVYFNGPSVPATSRVDRLLDWIKPIFKPSFLLLVPIACFLILRSEYLQKTTHREIPLTYDAWIILSPLRFFPCIILGEISDRIGHMKTMLVMELIAAIIFISNFFTGLGSDIVSTFGMFFFTSWIMTSQYVYISKTQPPAQFGRLSGAISLIAGFFLFFNIIISPYTEQPTGRLIVGIFMLSLSLVDVLIIGSTYIFDYKITWLSGFK